MAVSCRSAALRAAAGRLCVGLRLQNATRGAAAAATAPLAASLRGSGGAAARPLLAHGRLRSSLLFEQHTFRFMGIRWFSSEDRSTGSVKMWNEERGFGFINPNNGGEDVFVHRSALGPGVVLSSGAPVTYKASWDDRKKKYRAEDVAVGAPSDDHAGRGAASDAPMQDVAPSSRAAAAQPMERPRAHHIVGSFGDWAIQREPMAVDADSKLARYRITIRSDAPQAKTDRQLRREEFQILGDSSWEKRLYPAGGETEEVVVLQPGGATSRATSGHGKGHGRNWAVEGRPGTAFDILYDTDARIVSCQAVFSEGR